MNPNKPTRRHPTPYARQQAFDAERLRLPGLLPAGKNRDPLAHRATRMRLLRAISDSAGDTTELR